MQCQAVINLGPHVATYCQLAKGHDGKCQRGDNSTISATNTQEGQTFTTAKVAPRPRQFACSRCFMVNDCKDGPIKSYRNVKEPVNQPVCDDCHKAGA